MKSLTDSPLEFLSYQIEQGIFFFYGKCPDKQESRERIEGDFHGPILKILQVEVIMTFRRTLKSRPKEE